MAQVHSNIFFNRYVLQYYLNCGWLDVELQIPRADQLRGVGVSVPYPQVVQGPAVFVFTVIDLVGFRVCVLSSPLGSVVQCQLCFKTCSELSVSDLRAASSHLKLGW